MLCQEEIDRLNVADSATLGGMTAIGDFIKQVRKSRSLSQQKVGEAIGLHGQSAKQKIYRVERGDEDLTATQLADFLRIYEVDPQPLLGLDLKIPEQAARERGTLNKMRDDFDEFIPVFAFDIVNDAPVKRVVGAKQRPPSLRDVRDAYALYVPDDMMEPRYCRGWLLWVNPVKPPSEGRDAVVFTKTGGMAVRHIERRDGRLIAAALQAEGEIIGESDIATMHLIVGADQEG